MSKLLSLLFTKEWFARDSSKSLSKNKWFAWEKLIFCMFLTVCPHFKAQERITPVPLHTVTLFSRATGAIHSCCSKERLWANRSRHFASDLLLLLMKKSDRSDLLFFTSKWLFRSQKPMSEFPTLRFLLHWNNWTQYSDSLPPDYPQCIADYHISIRMHPNFHFLYT